MTAFMHDCSASSGTIPDLLHNFSNAPILDAKDLLLRTLVTKLPILLQLPTRTAKFAYRLRHELGDIAAEVWAGVKTSGGMHASVLNALCEFFSIHVLRDFNFLQQIRQMHLVLQSARMRQRVTQVAFLYIYSLFLTQT